jgi:hypothetical protein
MFFCELATLCTGTWTNSCSTRPTRYRRRSAARGEQQLSVHQHDQQLCLEQKLHLLDQQLHLEQQVLLEQLLFDQELQKQNLLQDLSLGSISFLRKMLSIFWHSCIFANTDMT